ncbi:MAG TPA: alpha-glucuronidase family glycosyl hydrolase [Candidatus Methylomirabilis sp.]|nr:alpha-glucuronidase family glycosyl hydrolase [Candidatus Methylomirabilis sp.]
MNPRRFLTAACVACWFFGLGAAQARAEDGVSGWLRYAPLEKHAAQQYAGVPATVLVLGDSPVLGSAKEELLRGLQGMLGTALRDSSNPPNERAYILGTVSALRRWMPRAPQRPELGLDGFLLAAEEIHGSPCIVIAGGSDRGVLYGVFALLTKIAQHENLDNLREVQQPYAPLRWADEWDNLDGSIERGYAGRSIFFENGNVRSDLTRAGEYARLLSSIGINGCSINNVNANPRVVQRDFLPQLARVADAFRRWGVQLSIAVDVSSPKTIGGLDTFDPMDPRVAQWWKEKVDEIYDLIPDFAGFVVKADSEGRPGPASYGRTPADAANVIARALEPHHGILFYRAFVYNHHLDWRDLKNDRARAAYDIFHPLDGKFDDNVIIQIKYGPIDFQVREPASPLFGGLEKTNQAIELQITQEYTGQQRHLCFLPPLWKTVLDFDMHAAGQPTPVKDLVAGKTFHRSIGGFVGVVNVGMDTNWLAHPLAMANLYGYGRLAWNPNFSAKRIAEEWTRLTFGNDSTVVSTLTRMLLESWPTYESYTGPLGIGTLTDILGSHYGPGVESSERNGWGQWHRADHDGVGMDRTTATGTGYVSQYEPPVAKIFESLRTTPDELLLFFHHVPYTYTLHSGKEVIQHIYDSHYAGAEGAAQLVKEWQTLNGRVDEERYDDVLKRLQYQAGHAIVWRDAVCNWFYRVSGIPDQHGRVGNYPGRIEAESMQLQGYVPIAVVPPETASGGKAIECPPPAAKCTATTHFQGAAGRYDIDIEYFDQNNGQSKFRLFVGDKLVDEWIADDHLPALKPNGDSSTRRRIPGITLQPGDLIRIEGVPDGEEHAPLDYIEIHSASN